MNWKHWLLRLLVLLGVLAAGIWSYLDWRDYEAELRQDEVRDQK